MKKSLLLITFIALLCPNVVFAYSFLFDNIQLSGTYEASITKYTDSAIVNQDSVTATFSDRFDGYLAIDDGHTYADAVLGAYNGVDLSDSQFSISMGQYAEYWEPGFGGPAPLPSDHFEFYSYGTNQIDLEFTILSDYGVNDGTADINVIYRDDSHPVPDHPIAYSITDAFGNEMDLALNLNETYYLHSDYYYSWNNYRYGHFYDIGQWLLFDLDNEAAPVPEPSTILLLCTGLSGLWASRRKSGKKH